MIDIQVKNLTKFFVIGENLLDGLSFDIQEGERVAILGRNGCGKTTLFKILTGEMDYDEGEVYVNPNKKLGLISQIPKFPDGYTVEDVLRSAYRELEQIRRKMERLEKEMASGDETVLRQYDDLSNRFTTGGGYEMDVEVDKICNGLGITPQQRSQDFASLSGGEKTRMNLARLLLEKTDILLLDEPTNHLDLHSVEWLEEYIRGFKGTVLAISHDRFFLDQVAQRIIEISDGHAEFYSGNYSFYIDEKQARFDLQMKQYQQEQAKLKQLGYTLERMKGWGINNRTLYRRAMSIQHRMERIEKTKRPTKDKTMKASFGEKDFSGDVVFTVKHMEKHFGSRELFSNVDLRVEGGERIAILGDNGTGKSTFLKCVVFTVKHMEKHFGSRELFSNVDLRVEGGERIAILGDNGTGKSTFLKCLMGEEDFTGKIQFGPTVKWGYLPQIIHFDHPERTLYDTMLYEKNCTPQTARDRLGMFLFSGEDVFKTVGTLSGGEQSRLRLCMLMDEKINLLILDEPTNHLDIASREWVEAAIEEFEGALLFVSHDRYFIEKFAERIWVILDEPTNHLDIASREWVEAAIEEFEGALLFVSHDRYFIEKFAERIWELEDGTIRDYPCGYAKYRSMKEFEKLSKPAPAAPVKEKKEKPKGGTKDAEKLVRKLEREIQKQEQTIADLDTSIEAAAADYHELTRLLGEKEAAEEVLMDLMEQWEQASILAQG